MPLRFLLLAALLCAPVTVSAAGSTLADGSAPKQGAILANFALPAPEDPEKAAYLGISPEADSFRLMDIEAKALLIEIFSMYCPFCQKEAPMVNEMFAKLRASDMTHELKMIGIGTGNSAYEVGVFRDKFQVAMPLFPDPDFTVYNTIGQVGTPFFILVQPRPDKDGLMILKVHEGILKDPEAFYTEIIDRVQNLQPVE